MGGCYLRVVEDLESGEPKIKYMIQWVPLLPAG